MEEEEEEKKEVEREREERRATCHARPSRKQRQAMNSQFRKDTFVQDVNVAAWQLQSSCPEMGRVLLSKHDNWKLFSMI